MKKMFRQTGLFLAMTIALVSFMGCGATVCTTTSACREYAIQGGRYCHAHTCTTHNCRNRVAPGAAFGRLCFDCID